MQVQLNGFEMAYEERGSGLPLLLIHGFPLNKEMWQPQLAALSDRARILAPDLRGHGESQAVPGPYSMEQLAGDCHALLEATGTSGRVVVAGLSMGGYVTLAFYRKYPHRVAGLVLAATRAGEDSPEGKTNRDKAAEKARAQGPAAVAADLLPKMLAPNTYATNPALVSNVQVIMEKTALEGMVGALMGMKARPDSTALLPHIEVPTLILHGADDQLFPATEAGDMQAAMPNARLVLLQDAGHLLNLEQAVLFNQAMRELLESV